MRNLLAVVIVLVAASAHAERPKYTRKQNLQLEPKLSERTRPVKPPPAEPKRIVTPDLVMQIHERQQPLRRDQERVLEKLVRDTPDEDAEKPELMFRLAEHYAAQLRFWRLKAVEETLR